MQVSTSAFYAWSKTPEDTDKKLLEKQLEAKALQLFEENRKTYGSRRLSISIYTTFRKLWHDAA